MKILAIETAIDACSVAIGEGEELIILKEEIGPNLHASHLGLLMEAAFRESGISPAELDAVCVSKGPGSYTGLRIGVSAAKGICYAHNLPLYAVSTLQSMAYGASVQAHDTDAWLCPMIDARRMEVYLAVYNLALEEVWPIQAAILTPELFQNIPGTQRLVLFGNGMPKAKEMFSVYPNVLFLDNIIPSAAWLLPLALKKIAAGEAEDLFRFEPFYLKDFIAKDPGAKIARVLKGE